MTASIIVFGVTLALLVLFITIKIVEIKNGIFFFKNIRTRIDEFVLRLEYRIIIWVRRLTHIPSVLILLKMTTHIFAHLVARVARATERTAHALARKVSHSHSVGSVDTKSPFLKEVTNHKNGLDKKSYLSDNSA